jgi:hypothetical protein
MKPLYLEEFKALVQHPQDICISIFLPTHRTEPEIQQNPIRLRNLIRKAEEKLIECGWRADDAKNLLQHFLQAQQKAIALCKQLIGTGKASSDISETVRAACQGRVDSLFVAQGQHQ